MLGRMFPRAAAWYQGHYYPRRVMRRLRAAGRVVEVGALIEDADEVTLSCIPQSAWNMRLFDIAVVSALLKRHRASALLEIGTFDGRTAVNLARSLSETGKVTTVDLPPDVTGRTPGQRLTGSIACKVRQIYHDSATLTPKQLGETYDAVVIDGDHSAHYVQSDSRLAMAVLRPHPSSLIIWDDVDYPHVLNGIEAASREMGFDYWHVAGTRLAIAFPFREGTEFLRTPGE